METPLAPLLPSLADVPLNALDGTRLLGLTGTPAALVRAGLPFDAFERLAAFLGVGDYDLAEALDLAPRTLARRRGGAFTPAESDRLLRLARLSELALVVFEDDEAAARWLRTTKRRLGGESPLKHADTAPGASEVEDVLYAIEFGFPS